MITLIDIQNDNYASYEYVYRTKPKCILSKTYKWNIWKYLEDIDLRFQFLVGSRIFLNFLEREVALMKQSPVEHLELSGTVNHVVVSESSVARLAPSGVSKNSWIFNNIL